MVIDRHETPTDKRNERAVIDALFPADRYRVEKLPERYELDFAIYTRAAPHDLLCLVEVKCRSEEYETLALSMLKWVALRRFASIGYTSILAVQLPSGIYKRHVLPGDTVRARFGGRRDRGDPRDMEPMVHIPMSTFRRIEA